MCTSLVPMLVLAAVAQAPDGKNEEPPIRIGDVVCVCIAPQGALNRGDEYFLLVGDGGKVDLEKIQKGYGQAAVYRRSWHEAEWAIHDHLADNGFDVRASVRLVRGEKVREELTRHEVPLRRTPSLLNRYKERISQLEHARDATNSEGVPPPDSVINVQTAVEVSIENAHSKNPRGVARLFVVPENGWVDVEVVQESFGRYQIAGKTAEEVAKQIQTQLRSTKPDAKVRVDMLGRRHLQAEIDSQKRSIENLIRHSKRYEQNISELKKALPLN